MAGGVRGWRGRADVVVGDGDAASRAQITELLARLGCSVREAVTGDEALAEVRRELPALVVLDAAPAGMTGYELSRAPPATPGQALPLPLLSPPPRPTRADGAGLPPRAHHAR